jgi:hypothetical protein
MICPTFVVGGALVEALESAKKAAGTDKVIFFDGAYGSMNLSPSLAAEMKAAAPGIIQTRRYGSPGSFFQRSGCRHARI